MATAPALWNQLRFNTDQPPTISNLISQPTASRPGAILLGPDTQHQFVYANSNTLELAQRLARRDVAKMREQATTSKPAPQASVPRNRSPVPASPVRPVQRLCKVAQPSGPQTKPKNVDEMKTKQMAEAAEEKRLKQQEKLRKRREAEEADLKRRREAREKAAATNIAGNVARTRVQQLQAAGNRNEMPARGDSPPVRDSDPQLVEIREQHQELMGMLRELIRLKPSSSKQQNNKAQTRGPSRIARAVSMSSTARPRGYLSETRASKGRQQQRPARRRPCEERRDSIEEGEVDDRMVQPMRLLNAMPSSHTGRQDTNVASTRHRQAILRDHLAKRLGTPSPTHSERQTRDVGETLTELLVDDVVGDATREIQHLETNSLPGNDGGEAFLEPTIDELDFRLQQIESEYDAIRQRWRCIEYEEVPPIESPSSSVPGDASLGPLVLDNKAILFTKRPNIHYEGPQGAEKRRLLPRPPQHITIGLPRITLRSINSARERYLDWIADRPGPRFSVDIATVADWLCADLVDEVINAGVHDIDKASDDIVHMMLEGEMAVEEVEEGEGSTLADGDDYVEDENESSSFESESASSSSSASRS